MAESKTSVIESVIDREYGEAEYNDLKKLYEGSMGKISEGEIVRGRVVANLQCILVGELRQRHSSLRLESDIN